MVAKSSAEFFNTNIVYRSKPVNFPWLEEACKNDKTSSNLNLGKTVSKAKATNARMVKSRLANNHS